ncbi:MAG: hydantoinase/oxoprolinase family protein, partial [Nitrospinota bacterium]
MRIGIDTGGTFTDFVLIDQGEIRTYKCLSTPDNPGKAVLQGLQELVAWEKGREVVHGSTVATNALLERKGAQTALITTQGFEDILEIGRQTRKEIYNFFVTRPTPLVPPAHRYGLAERTLYSGEILQRVSRQEVEAVLQAIRQAGIESVAICFLHSYANPANEAEVLQQAKTLGLHVSASHQILPEYREYERCSTTVVNAYVSPLMERYLSFLTDHLSPTPLRIMQSNGGAISAERAKVESVRTILSGPAGGVVGAFQVAKWAGYDQIISFDMGGTSTDVSLCPGYIKTTTEATIADCPIKVPILDIHTVGAGGGSIAVLDAGGALRVGPQSAGADPGPVCYGKGNAVTVTDANLYLGRLR